MAKKRVFQQERAERTYRAILSAAAKVFPKRGFDGTQVPDIARAAGVSVGIVYRYFDDKREIFLEMLESHLTAARAEVSARLSPDQFLGAAPADAIARVVGVVFDEAKRDPALAKVYLAVSLTDKDVAKIRIESETHDRSVIAAILETAISRERVPEPHAAALVIERAVQGTAVDCVIGSKTVTPEAAKAALQSMLVRWLLGS